MNLLLTTFEFPPDIGGVGTSVNRIAHGLSQSGDQVTVVVFDDPLPERGDTSVTYQRQNEVDIYRIHPSTAGPGEIPTTAVDIPSVDSLYYEALTALVRKIRPDLLHGFYLSATGFVTTLIGKEYDIPVVVSIRGDDMMGELFMGRWFAMLQYILENASFITAVSQEALTRAQNIAAITCPTKIIWNSLSSVPPTPAIELPPSFTAHPIIATAGNLRRNKGIHNFLGDIAGLDQPLSFLLIGDTVEREKEFWQAVFQNLPPHITLHRTGLVSQAHVHAYFKQANIAVFPSIRDGCPNAMIEAMSVGLPIIGTHAGAIGDIIAAADCGIVLDPFPLASGQYAAALQTLLDNPIQAAQYAQNARQFVEKNLTLDIELNHWRSTYRQIL